MSIVSDLLPTLDNARSLLDEVGLRPLAVARRVATWTGARPALGDRTVTITPITVANGKRPKVRQLDDRELVASGGILGTARYAVGPLTPDYGAGGTKAADIQPEPGADPSEVQFLLYGPGQPASGMLCKLVSVDFSSPFRVSFVIEALGQAGETA